MASSVSSCGRAFQPSSRLALRGPVGPEPARRGHLGGRQRRCARGRSAAAPPTAAASAARHLQRWLDPGQPPEVGEEAVEGEVAPAEDVALAHLAQLVGEQVAGGHVAHVDHVDRPVGVGGHAAEQEAAHQPGRRDVDVARAEHDRRVHADERQAPPRQAGAPRPRPRARRSRTGCRARPPVKSCDSSAVPPRAAGPSAAALEVRTTRSTPARSASSSTVRVPPTSTSNIRSASTGPHRGHAGGVENPVDALQRAPHRAPVEHVGAHQLRVEIVDRRGCPSPRGR